MSAQWADVPGAGGNLIRGEHRPPNTHPLEDLIAQKGTPMNPTQLRDMQIGIDTLKEMLLDFDPGHADPIANRLHEALDTVLAIVLDAKDPGKVATDFLTFPGVENYTTEIENLTTIDSTFDWPADDDTQQRAWLVDRILGTYTNGIFTTEHTIGRAEDLRGYINDGPRAKADGDA